MYVAEAKTQPRGLYSYKYSVQYSRFPLVHLGKNVHLKVPIKIEAPRNHNPPISPKVRTVRTCIHTDH
jgi:hypothetical protein